MRSWGQQAVWAVLESMCADKVMREGLHGEAAPAGQHTLLFSLHVNLKTYELHLFKATTNRQIV